jgi:hypothetical protein
MRYVHQAFPAWRYHRTEAARIVPDQTASDGLGQEWAETPAAFLDSAELEMPAAFPDYSAAESALQAVDFPEAFDFLKLQPEPEPIAKPARTRKAPRE